LASAPVVVPGNHGLLNANQATRVAAALAQFLPAEANVAFESEAPSMMLTVMDKNQLAAVLQQRQRTDASSGQRLWVITSRGGSAIDSLGLHDLQAQGQAALLDQMHS